MFLPIPQHPPKNHKAIDPERTKAYFRSGFDTVKQLFVIWTCCLLVFHLAGQTADSLRPKPPRKFNQATGLVGYYFWHEDTTGIIDTSSFSKPFFQNALILQRPDRTLSPNTSVEALERSIVQYSHNPKWDPANHYPFYRRMHPKERKLLRNLSQEKAHQPTSIVFRQRGDTWISEQLCPVVYFTVDPQQHMRYSRTSDSLVVPDLQLALPANGVYEVVHYLNAQGLTDSSKVYGMNGFDFTDSLRNCVVSKPVRILLLVNGYRGPKKDDDPGDGILTQKDRYHYWYKIDNRFEETLKPAVMLYMDGSFPIATSNHRTKLHFGMSWLRTKLTPKRKAIERIYKRLNTNPNPEGFEARKAEGRLAGEAFLLARCLNPLSDTVKDTLDIVCHSMGYACTLGFLDIVKDKVVLGNCYIIAPENAGAEGYNWKLFEHVWQYGSNLDQPCPDPLREQDGIAPQCAVKGLNELPADRGGRIFIPSDWPNKNFVDSHMIYSYDWLFDCIPEGEPGSIEK